MREVFSVYGSASHVMLSVAAAAFVFVLLAQGCTWMMASDRVQAVAAADGAFPRWFGEFHAGLGTPVRVNVLSGVVATAFMFAGAQLHGAASAAFGVVLNMAVSTLLISYLAIVPTALRLRRRFPDVERPFRVAGGRAGVRICVVLGYAWVLLGSWQTVAPGVLEHALGVRYDFAGTWGTSRVTFELFTFGTLAVIVAVALIGHAVARRPADLRAQAGSYM